MLLALLLFFGPMGITPPLPATAPVTFSASDGVTVYAQPYNGKSPDAPLILLFHQAGSSKNEYAPIAPRLAELGFNALAIDQRSGGDLYAPGNETVEHLGRSAEYEEALRDLEAAVKWARQTHSKSPVIVWGSSYSAALLFLLAADRPKDVAALLAFSPGEYLKDKDSVHRAARRLHIPIFIDSAADKNEEDAARSIFAVIPSKAKVLFVPHNGTHGASTLRADKDPSGYDENWRAVVRFLRRLHF